MGERISAFENIGQDFGWLPFSDPSVIQGLLTLGAAALGASVALHIARSVYPLQKEKDRELKIEEEKRGIYRDFLRSVDALINSNLFGSLEKKLELYLECKSALNEVLIFADSDTALAMYELKQKSSDLAFAIPKLDDDNTDEAKELARLRTSVEAHLLVALNAARLELRGDRLDLDLEVTVLQKRKNKKKSEQ
mgnify:CR=1 FL=1